MSNMKNMIKNKFAICELLILTMSFLSCSSDKTYDFEGNDGRIYVRVGTSGIETNFIDVVLSKTPLGIFGEANASFHVLTTMPAEGDVAVICMVDNSLVETYNKKNKTKYLQINPDCLLLNNIDIVVGDGEVRSKKPFEIKLNSEKAADLELGDYLIPIKLVKKDGLMEVSKDYNTVYVHLSISNDTSKIPFGDRTNWTIKDYSSYDNSKENNIPEHILDGKTQTIWHTLWESSQPKPPHHITIDMGEVVNFAGFQYITRNNGTGCPVELRLDISLDNEKWVEVKTYDKLPNGRGSTEFKTLFDSCVDARYFRLVITKSSHYYSALAEVNAYYLKK